MQFFLYNNTIEIVHYYSLGVTTLVVSLTSILFSSLTVITKIYSNSSVEVYALMNALT